MKAESAIAIQGRVLFALIMREMATRFGRTAGGYLWAVLEPVATLTLMVLVFSQISHTPPLGRDYTLFFASGYMAFHVYRDVSSTVSNSIIANRSLLSFPRITILDTIVARFVLQALTSVLVTSATLGVIYAFSDEQDALDYAPILTALGLAAGLGLAVGALNSLLFPCSPTWDRVFGVINRPLFLISGVFFIPDDLPRVLREILWWNPLVHITATMREGFYATYHPEFVSHAYVLSWMLVCAGAALLLARVLRARILEG